MVTFNKWRFNKWWSQMWKWPARWDTSLQISCNLCDLAAIAYLPALENFPAGNVPQYHDSYCLPSCFWPPCLLSWSLRTGGAKCCLELLKTWKVVWRKSISNGRNFSASNNSVILSMMHRKIQFTNELVAAPLSFTKNVIRWFPSWPFFCAWHGPSVQTTWNIIHQLVLGRFKGCGAPDEIETFLRNDDPTFHSIKFPTKGTFLLCLTPLRLRQFSMLQRPTKRAEAFDGTHLQT